jgi:hypothetical protein
MLWEKDCSSMNLVLASWRRTVKDDHLYLRALYAFDTCHPVSFAPRSGNVDVKLLVKLEDFASDDQCKAGAISIKICRFKRSGL